MGARAFPQDDPTVDDGPRSPRGRRRGDQLRPDLAVYLQAMACGGLVTGPAQRRPNVFARAEPRATAGGAAEPELGAGGARSAADTRASRGQSPASAQELDAGEARPDRPADGSAQSP